MILRKLLALAGILGLLLVTVAVWSLPQNGSLQVFRVPQPQDKLGVPPSEAPPFTAELRWGRLRSCLLTTLSTPLSVWDRLHSLVNACRAHAGIPGPAFIPLGADKLYYPFRSEFADGRECVHVTLGIGNEVGVEKRLQKRYPACRFFGADARDESAAAFAAVGKYVVASLEAEKKPRSLFLLRDHKYQWTNVSNSMTLDEFFKGFVKEPIVHFLAMDIEGSEYRILPSYNWNRQTPIICQLTLELHGPLRSLGQSGPGVTRILHSFLANSPFAPVFALPPGNHHRVALWNPSRPECRRLFQLNE